ncbi:NADH flavin oxidoreductase/NADH oxidase, partial [Rhizoctonia solani AG-3 Rhs1AP]
MTQPKLFTPIRIGDLVLSHRVILAPLTRFRADDNHVHHDIAAEYYSQRAATPGSLLISEATIISPEAGGYDNVPGIWNKEQIAGWKKVVDAVHKQGSHIFLQLWAIGRAADPRVLDKEGYPGYLIDQFNQDVCNKRTDEYGGNIENRSRFALEVLEAVVAAVGAKRTGIRFSPWTTFQGMRMKNPIPTFAYLVSEIAQRYPDLAYMHFIEPVASGSTGAEDESRDRDTNGELTSNDFARIIWQPRPFFSAGGFKPESAFHEAETKGTCVVMGRYFISNPDLPERLRHGIPLAPYNRGSFYTAGPKAIEGYIDYPPAGRKE